MAKREGFVRAAALAALISGVMMAHAAYAEVDPRLSNPRADATASAHAASVADSTPVRGWVRLGNTAPDKYEIGIDADAMVHGHSPCYIRSLKSVTGGYGALTKRRPAAEFAGKRVRMRGWAMTAEVGNRAGLWMRVEGKAHDSVLAFDNMAPRPIKGNTDWMRYSIVLDVPKDADQIAYGGFIEGIGELWIQEPIFDIVDVTVPTTGKDLGPVRDMVPNVHDQ